MCTVHCSMMWLQIWQWLKQTQLLFQYLFLWMFSNSVTGWVQHNPVFIQDEVSLNIPHIPGVECLHMSSSWHEQLPSLNQHSFVATCRLKSRDVAEVSFAGSSGHFDGQCWSRIQFGQLLVCIHGKCSQKGSPSCCRWPENIRCLTPRRWSLFAIWLRMLSGLAFQWVKATRV